MNNCEVKIYQRSKKQTQFHILNFESNFSFFYYFFPSYAVRLNLNFSFRSGFVVGDEEDIRLNRYVRAINSPMFQKEKKISHLRMFRCISTVSITWSTVQPKKSTNFFAITIPIPIFMTLLL